jgi:hypothetical protein
VRYSCELMGARTRDRLLTVGGMLLTVGFAAWRPIPAQACSCANLCKPESACIKESFKYAAAVFVGTPVEIVVQHLELKLGDRTIPTVNYHERFAVKESFKGMTTSYVFSDNGSGSGDCSYGKMDEGRDYLIYADSGSEGSSIHIHGCSRTRPLDGGLRSNPFPDSDWPEEIRKSMVAGQKATQKELILLRKLRSRSAPTTH